MKRNLIIAGGIVLLALLAYLLWPVDPRAALIRDLEDLAERTSQGEHLALLPRVSQSIHQRAQDKGFPLAAFAQQIRKHDQAQNAQYEFIELLVFEPDSYAEGRFQRSINAGSQVVPFTLPFIVEEEEWKVHDQFQDRSVHPRDLPFMP